MFTIITKLTPKSTRCFSVEILEQLVILNMVDWELNMLLMSAIRGVNKDSVRGGG